MRSLGLVVIGLSSLGVAGYAFATYLGRPVGAGVHPQMRAVYENQRLGIYSHIFASAVALLLGPWQFLPAFRVKYPRWHRTMGCVYLLIGVGIGGVSALYMSAFAYGGWVSTSGFSLLALLWMFTGVRAFQFARARQFSRHREWMIRNFALTFAAVTLRIGLGIGFALQLPFELFYPALAWLAWVPNLLLMDWWIRQSRLSAGKTSTA
jgi:uncharacterized membrane protein